MKKILPLLLTLALAAGPALTALDGHAGGLHAQKIGDPSIPKGGGKKEKKDKKGGATAKPTVDQAKLKERVDYLFIEANTLYLQDKKVEAIVLYKELLQLDPKNDAALFNVGKIQNELENHGEAVKACKQALELDPENPWYYHELVLAYEGTREMDKALATQQAMARKFPDDKDCLYDLAQLYIGNKDFAHAVEVYAQLEKLTGANAEIAFRKHQLYIYLNQPEKALAELDQLLARDPQESRYWMAKHDVLMLMGKPDEARALLEQLLTRNPNDGFALLSLADYYKSKGQMEKSDEYLQRAFDNPDVELDTKVKILGSLYQSAGGDAQVLARLDRMSSALLRLHPRSALVLGIRGDVLQASQQADSARSYYRRSIAIDGTNEEVWTELLLMDSEVKDFPAMQKDAEKALEYFPNNVAFLYFFGNASVGNKDYEEAIYAFEKVKKMETKDRDLLLQTYLQLAESYHHEEQFAKCDENFEAALRLVPGDPTTLNNYAYYLSLRGARLDDAAKMVQQSLAAQPTNSAYQDTYGWILFLQGKYTEAEQWIGKAVAAGADGEVLEHYGDTWAKLGDMDKARGYWQKAIEKGSKFTIAEKLKSMGQ